MRDGKRYFTDGTNGLFKNVDQTNPLVGFHQILLLSNDVDERIWNDDRMTDDRWYTVVFPFDVPYIKLQMAYGDDVDLREFEGVSRTQEGTKEIYTLLFNERVKIPETTAERSKNAYALAHHPYMIRPSAKKLETDGLIYRTVTGENVKSYKKAMADAGYTDEAAYLQSIEESKLISVKKPLMDKISNTETPDAFTFIGNYHDQKMPADRYYLGYEPDRGYPLGFYHTTAESKGNNWKKFTAIVKGNTTDAKANYMGIAFDLYDNEETNAIRSVVAAEKPATKSMAVYSLSGQKVAEGSLQALPKGIYVMGGRKYVVR